MFIFHAIIPALGENFLVKLHCLYFQYPWISIMKKQNSNKNGKVEKMVVLVMAVCMVVWKTLYNFKIKRAQEARHNQSFFQNFQNNEIFEIFKMFKNNSWINIYYTKSKRLQSLDCLFCFQLEIPFSGKFGPKTQNYWFKLKFCTQTNSNMQNSIVMFTFSVFDWKYLFGQIWSKKLKLSVWSEISD